jgi:hypothetical protein
LNRIKQQKQIKLEKSLILLLKYMTNFQPIQSRSLTKSSDRLVDCLIKQAYTIGYMAGFLTACLDNFCNWLLMVIEG